MNALVITSLLLLCAALLVRLYQQHNAWRRPDAPWPFRARRLRSSPRQVLYGRLVAALPRHMVLSRVPLSSVLGVIPGNDLATWSRRLHSLQYDFVVCTRDASVLAAIALDDKAPGLAARTQRDLTLERATAAAGIPLLRWHVRALPDPTQIRRVFGEPLLKLQE